MYIMKNHIRILEEIKKPSKKTLKARVYQQRRVLIKAYQVTHLFPILNFSTQEAVPRLLSQRIVVRSSLKTRVCRYDNRCHCAAIPFAFKAMIFH